MTRKDRPWNESNPEWWEAQIKERGAEYAWQWLVNEHEAWVAFEQAARRALMMLDEDWPNYRGDHGYPLLPEDHNGVPWPVRNFVRRVRAALTEDDPA